MSSDLPDRPPRESEPAIDPDWWKDVLRQDGGAWSADPLTGPLPEGLLGTPLLTDSPSLAPERDLASSTEPATIEPVPSADPVPPAEQLLAAPATAPRGVPGTDVGAAPLVDAPPVESGPLPTAVAQEPPGLPEGGAPAAPDLLADPHAAPPPQGTAAPLSPASATPPAPQRLHVPRVELSPPVPVPTPHAPGRPRRRAPDDLGVRVSDVALVLLAMAVLGLVYLALTR